MATTTPNYGWDVPTSTDYVADGAVAIEALGDDIDSTLYTALGGAYPGLRLIKSQVVGSGVASVTVTNCFSATYTNYRVVFTGGTATASGFTLGVRGDSGTGSAVLYSGDYVDLTGSRVALSGTVAAFVCSLTGNTGMVISFDVTNPFTATSTGFIGTVSYAHSPGGAWSTRTSGIDTQTTSSTGLTFTPGSGTLTGGTISVYGYGIS